MSCYPARGVEAAADSTFSFTITRASGAVVVTAHGCLDVAGSERLYSVLVDLIDGQGNLAVVLDAQDLTVTDPGLLGVLVAPMASIIRRGGRLSVADPSAATFDALDANGLNSAVAVTRSRPRALESAPKSDNGRRWSMALHPARGLARQPLPPNPPDKDQR